MNYQNLLKPVQIGNHIVKNSLVYPNASPHFLQGPETFPAEGYRAFVANLAKNGAGIVTVAVVAWEQPDGYMRQTRTGGGYAERDTIEFIRLNESVIDVMRLRENNGCTSHPTGFNFTQGVHPAMDFAARMKKAGVKMLLEPIGGFQEPEEMDRAVAEGKCDMFGMSRGFIADPDCGAKVYSGRGGAENVPEAGSVVICGGMSPLREKAMAYSGLSDVFFPIGGCNFVGNIQKCAEEACARPMII